MNILNHYSILITNNKIMKLQIFEVQFETQVKQPGQDHGYLHIQTFQAYDERHLWQVMKEHLGYYPPIYHIITPEQTLNN